MNYKETVLSVRGNEYFQYFWLGGGISFPNLFSPMQHDKTAISIPERYVTFSTPNNTEHLLK
jgi:hypothetical protein